MLVHSLDGEDLLGLFVHNLIDFSNCPDAKFLIEFIENGSLIIDGCINLLLIDISWKRR